jgi:hypothetical protein
MFRTFKSFNGSFVNGRRFVGRIQNPTKVPNNTYWFSAYENSAAEFGSVLANNAAVATWKDKSGAAHDLNKAGNASLKPVYQTNIQNGKGAVYFDGVDDSLNVNPISFLQSLGAFTMFVVAKPGLLNSGAALISTDTDGYKIFYNGTNWAVTAANGTGSSTSVPNTNMSIFTIRFDGSQTGNDNRLNFRINKTAQTLTFSSNVGTTTSASATYFYAGQNSNGTAFFKGHMGEIVLYSRALSNFEIESVENYFIDRWAIGSNSLVSNGLTLYLDANDSTSYSGSGSTWTDLAGGDSNITLVNSPTYTSGSPAYFTFNGVNQYGTGSNANVVPTTTYTKAVWFYLNGYNDNNLVSGDGHFLFMGSQTNRLYAGHANWNTLGGSYVDYPSTATISLNTWYHACVTFSTTNGFTLYINGVQDSTYTARKTAHPGTGTVNIATYNGGNILNGRISKVWCYNRELSSSEVAQNFNLHKALYGL